MNQAKPAIVLCCVFAALSVWLLATRPAVAVTDSDGNRELVVVTGGYANGMEVLYVMDARTKHLAVYRVDNGRSLKLVAARDCTFDMLLESYGDGTESEFMPAVLRKHWAKYNAEASGGSAPTELGKEKPPEGGR
ncbi:MAG: hypothetical protein EXS14_05850 [Planctomycetes bacterium]|nr:hypothetical protein [Planctomycetota bacterium]